VEGRKRKCQGMLHWIFPVIFWHDSLNSGVQPLRLIIMSATLRVSDFAENQRLFSSPAPIINVAARQHSVTIHFNRRTPSDYITEAIKKASKIHCRLPPGGILIFLTGQNEITGVCRKLEAKFGGKALDTRRRRRNNNAPSRSRTVDTEEQSQVLPFRMVSLSPSGRKIIFDDISAEFEAEDFDLGHDGGDLAFDVDEDMADEDPEALDSDDDQAGENEALGIDVDETESKHFNMLP
jgi:ATP-dependent RNA helicase DHX37/DHR1